MKLFGIIVLLAAASSAAILKDTRETGPPCPIPDPLNSPAKPINATLDPLFRIDMGSSRGDLLATGLSGLSYEYTIILITLTLDFHLTLPSVHLSGEYDATGYLDARPFSQACVPSGNYSGNGSAFLDASQVELDIRVVLFANLITNKLSIRTLTINTLSFGGDVSMSFGPNWLIGGSPVEWESWSAGLKACFDAEFAANKAAITEKIRLAGNGWIGQYTIDELLELIGGGGGPCPTPSY